MINYKLKQDYTASGKGIVGIGFSPTLTKVFAKNTVVEPYGTNATDGIYVIDQNVKYKIPFSVITQVTEQATYQASYQNPSTQNPSTNIDTNKYVYAFIGSSLGSVVGLGYAFAKKKRFWGYVGYMILGTIILGTTGGIIDYARNKNK